MTKRQKIDKRSHILGLLFLSALFTKCADEEGFGFDSYLAATPSESQGLTKTVDVNSCPNQITTTMNSAESVDIRDHSGPVGQTTIEPQ